MNDYEPLKVVAELRDPVILDRMQPLDGILAATIIETPRLRERDRHYRHFRRNVAKYGREDAENYWRAHGWEIPLRPHFLPLALWGHGIDHGLWVYCSSWAFTDEMVESGVTYFNHHFDIELAERFLPPKQRKIPTGKSEFKSEHIPLQYVTVERLMWYVLGIKRETEDVLSVTYAIAKKRNRGYGGIRRWSVESTATDSSVFSSGKLARPIPSELLEKQGITGQFQYAWTTYRPPYWDGRYVARCAVAGKRDDESTR